MSEVAEQVQVEGGTVQVTEEPNKVQQTAGTDPAELAATTYTLYLPRFHALLNKMSNKQLRRVFLAAIEHPLYDENPKFTTEDERVAFALSTHLLEAKMAMIMSTMFSKVALDQVNWNNETSLDGTVPTSQDTNNQELNKE
jgi:hypothetical protein